MRFRDESVRKRANKTPLDAMKTEGPMRGLRLRERLLSDELIEVIERK